MCLNFSVTYVGVPYTLGDHPGMKRIHQGRSSFLTYSSPDIRFRIANFAFNFI